MTELFMKIVNMSITASILVGIVLILRLVFKKAPKWVSVLLWGLVAIRLILPFGIESAFSLMPNTDWIQTDQPAAPMPVMPDTITSTEIGEDVVVTYVTVEPPISVRKNINLTYFLPHIWLAGIAVMAAYTVISYVRVYRSIRRTKHLRHNIYIGSNVPSPFVFGIIHPRICLPDDLIGADMEYIIAHEQAHIMRRDHVWKPLGFLLLTVHWFNPLIWLAYTLLCRDIEMACDEHVVRDLTDAERADYAQALLDCSISRRWIAACPLAFGEVGVKERIKSVLSYQKPAFFAVAAAIVVCIAAAVCFLTDPEQAVNLTEAGLRFPTDDPTAAISCDIRVSGKIKNGEFNGDFSVDGRTIAASIDLSRLTPPVSYYEGSRLQTYGLLFVFNETLTRFALRTEESREYVLCGMTREEFEAEMAAKNYYVDYLHGMLSDADGERTTLTLSDVITLAEKGYDLTWEDFSGYACRDVGSGLYICRYEIDNTFYLLIGDGKMTGTPMYIRLCRDAGDARDAIDIRDGGVQTFIEKQSDGAYTVKITRPDLAIYTEPGYDFADTGSLIDIGTYTIIEETTDAEGIRWGRLKSGAGWIDLDKAGEDAPHIPMTAEFASDAKLAGRDYHTHTVTDSPYTQKLLFRVYEPLTTIRFTALDFTADGISEGSALYTLETMTADKPLVIGVVFPGDLTTYGISFTDAAGEKHSYMLYLSGRNGSLVMQEYSPR